jgi:hypothetical protein
VRDSLGGIRQLASAQASQEAVEYRCIIGLLNSAVLSLPFWLLLIWAMRSFL